MFQYSVVCVLTGEIFQVSFKNILLYAVLTVFCAEVVALKICLKDFL